MTKRNAAIQGIVDGIAIKFGAGRTQSKASQQGVCTWCGSLIGPFRNAISEKEYSISGFCQKCQDETFGEDSYE